ncbi:Hypothetical_protein [Hexamita inflata]|uniref:Hypothetical_protein n=1 Tax=Hexamita inflata TaxID=28002 RepID=A0AA86PDY5_9EUKA|nr:Hypothetical protein HINF_LOCUS25010 [Hexamita inflata]
MERFIHLTKTELFDCVWTPCYFRIMTKVSLLPAEIKIEYITQNRSIDDKLLMFTSNDFSQNTDIQDRGFQDLATHLLVSFNFKFQQLQYKQNNFILMDTLFLSLDFSYLFKYELCRRKSHIFINGVDQNEKCSKQCGNFQNITISM